MNIKESFQGAAFGLMDGVTTLLGILVGVAAATGNAKLVIVSGLVGGIANSFGNAVGFYTSEFAERGQQLEFYKDGKKHEKKYIHSHSEIIASASLSFIASVLALIFPILPFFLISDITTAILICIAISVVILFSLGYYIGKINVHDGLASGVKYVLLGMVSASVGFVVGDVVKHFILGGTQGT